MSKDILGSLVRAIVTVPEDRLGIIKDLCHKLSGNEGLRWEKEVKKLLRKNFTSPYFEYSREIVINQTFEQFVAKDKFVVNTQDDASIKIFGFNKDFDEWFLSGDSKIEPPAAKKTLVYHQMKRNHYDNATLRELFTDRGIISQLGGEDKSEITLSGLYALLEKQRAGEDGDLLTGGNNIFYIRDKNGVLRKVCVGWSDDGYFSREGHIESEKTYHRPTKFGWFLSAESTEERFIWNDSHRVFSNDYLPEFSESVLSVN